MGVFSGLWRRLLPGLRTRSLDAAGGGRRWAGDRRFGWVNSELSAASLTVRQRTAWLARNNGWATSGVNAWIANLVGTGVKPQSLHPDPAVRAALHARWAEWTDEADVDVRCDFYGLQALAARSMVEAGESFTLLTVTPFGLRLQVLDADMIPTDLTQTLPNGGRIVQGVEYAAAGPRVAYHVRRQRPDLPSIISPLEVVRVPAEHVAHLATLLVPGQVRGLSWLTPVALALHDLGSCEDAHRMRQAVAALFAGFIKKPDGQGGMLGESDAEPEPTLEPGTLSYLGEGEEITFPATPEVHDAVEFLRLELRGIAAGLGVPTHLLDGDLSQANYSSLRASLIDFRGRVEALQHQVLVFQWCRPIWRAFVVAELLAGRIAGDVDELFKCEWVTPAALQVDPQKDLDATATQLGQGLTSRRRVVASYGWDIEQLDAEIAADRDRAKALGLSFPFPAPSSSGTSSAPTSTPRPVIGAKNVA
jgi:lambda family phage portal protein